MLLDLHLSQRGHLIVVAPPEGVVVIGFALCEIIVCFVCSWDDFSLQHENIVGVLGQGKALDSLHTHPLVCGNFFGCLGREVLSLGVEIQMVQPDHVLITENGQLTA